MVEAKERTRILSPNPLQSWSLYPLETHRLQQQFNTLSTYIINIVLVFPAFAAGRVWPRETKLVQEGIFQTSLENTSTLPDFILQLWREGLLPLLTSRTGNSGLVSA